MSAPLFSVLTDEDRRRGAELPCLFDLDIVYVHGKGWVSLTGLAPDGGFFRGDDHPLDDLDHGIVLALRAQAIKNSIVDATGVNAQLSRRDRRFRVVQSATDGGLDGGHVAAISERQLHGQITGDSHQKHVHQLSSGEVGLKVGHRGHGLGSSLIARIKALFRGRVE